MQSRKRSVFSSPEWKSVPWSTRSKSPKDTLLDILVEIPALLEDLEVLAGLPAGSDKRLCLYQQLEQRCWSCDGQLQTWSTSHGAPTLALVESIITIQERNRTSPSSEQFAMAHLGMIYWTTCNLLYQITSFLRTGSPQQLLSRMDPRIYCRNIGLLIPYFQCPGMGSFFLSIVGFPATVAVSYLARQDDPGEFSDERRLLLRAFQGKHGGQLHRFLATWPWQSERERDIVNRWECDPRLSL